MNTPRAPLSLNAQVRSDATDWLLRFSQGDADAGARADFLAWLRASPEHVRAYLRICAFWQEAHQLDGNPAQRDVQSLIELAAREANIEILPYIQKSLKVRPQVKARSSWKRIAAAAVISGLLGGGAWYYQVQQHNTYMTQVGEQRTVNLPDGSTVIINARSGIKVEFTDAERDVELIDGQALFRVAKNIGRPFVVHSGSANVRAIGTQFDVYRTATGTVVTVVEGKVTVNEGRTGTSVAAGEQAIVTAQAVLKPPGANVAAATAWTHGLLMFDAAPLSEVIREFNRQNPKTIVLASASLSELRISGSFPASGSERLVHFLQERFHVQVSETDQEIRISRAQ